MSEAKRFPYMKFYARDWRGDGALRMCSFAARGLWVDLLTIMHDEGDPYGHLSINGTQPTTSHLARMLGGTPKEVERLLGELEGAGVFSRTEAGTIYSRRMVRDKIKADTDRANGKDGGGNPNLIRPDKGGVNPPVKAHTQIPIPDPIPQPSRKKEVDEILAGLGVGKRAGVRNGVTVQDPSERLARFQRTIAEGLGREGYAIVGAASDPASPEFERCLALCKAQAAKIGKGWPRQWPDRATAENFQ